MKAPTGHLLISLFSVGIDYVGEFGLIDLGMEVMVSDADREQLIDLQLHHHVKQGESTLL